jgi:hypothetical protein
MRITEQHRDAKTGNAEVFECVRHVVRHDAEVLGDDLRLT